MCGITGYVQLDASQSESTLLANVTASAAQIAHRGPDATGAWADATYGIALGHRRLSIIDLSPTGAQPMHSHSERYVTVYNGEIYNYQDLATALSAQGVQFRGTSDTEVMLAAFDMWGIPATLEKLTGMYAIAVWDQAEKTLWLARDRMGEKPLYYGYCGNQFGFASELKAFQALETPPTDISEDAASLMLRLGYIPAPYSIYTNVAKLPPAHYVTLSFKDLKTRQQPTPIRYWNLPQQATAPALDDATVLSTFSDKLSAVIKRQMISDVPLGAFLSGGIDSSLVVALMQAQSTTPVRTFTIGFTEASHNEAVHAKEIAQHLGTDHTEFYLTHADAQAIVPQLSSMYDEPFADSSQIPTHMVCKMARQHVTVALSGDAGDELLGGYHRYHNLPRAWEQYQRNPLRTARWPQQLFGTSLPSAKRMTKAEKALTAYTNLANAKTPRDFYPHYVYRNWLGTAASQHAFDQYTNLIAAQAAQLYSENDTQYFMAFDVLSYLPDDILVKMDRAAMATSLETRIPFLDHDLVDYIWQLPYHYKVRDGSAKWLSKQLLAQHVPLALFDRRKQGFGIPIATWLRNGDIKDWAADLLSTAALEQTGFLPTNVIQRRWQQHLAGHTDWSTLLWRVLMLQAWRSHWHA